MTTDNPARPIQHQDAEMGCSPLPLADEPHPERLGREPEEADGVDSRDIEVVRGIEQSVVWQRSARLDVVRRDEPSGQQVATTIAPAASQEQVKELTGVRVQQAGAIRCAVGRPHGT